MGDNATHCYIARKPCGCLVGITVDDPDDPKDTAKFVSQQVRNGCSIERLTIEDGRSALKNFGCRHRRKRKS